MARLYILERHVDWRLGLVFGFLVRVEFGSVIVSGLVWM